jgi:hypothetical protein
MSAQAKEIKNKVMCEINSFLLFFFSLMIDSLIKQQTAWSQGSSKFKKNKRNVLVLKFRLTWVFICI